MKLIITKYAIHPGYECGFNNRNHIAGQPFDETTTLRLHIHKDVPENIERLIKILNDEDENYNSLYSKEIIELMKKHNGVINANINEDLFVISIDFPTEKDALLFKLYANDQQFEYLSVEE